jgi:hypothetical protein
MTRLTISNTHDREGHLMTTPGRETGQSKLSLADEAEQRLMFGEEIACKRLTMLSKGYIPLPSTGKRVSLFGWSNLDADGRQCGIQPTIEDIYGWSEQHPE